MRYEAAGTLVTLSSAPTAIKAAASCYIELVVKESDNNVKLIVLDRLIAMKDSPAYERVLQDLVMDVLRVLGDALTIKIRNYVVTTFIALSTIVFFVRSFCFTLAIVFCVKQDHQPWRSEQKLWL